jgi:hypothetical protein
LRKNRERWQVRARVACPLLPSRCRHRRHCCPTAAAAAPPIFRRMGLLFSSLFSSLFGRREYRILILGLDNAGKTTILYRLQVDEPVTTVPTIGFNVETLKFKNLTFQVWDLGGQSSIRPYWRCYYPNT